MQLSRRLVHKGHMLLWNVNSFRNAFLLDVIKMFYLVGGFSFIYLLICSNILITSTLFIIIIFTGLKFYTLGVGCFCLVINCVFVFNPRISSLGVPPGRGGRRTAKFPDVPVWRMLLRNCCSCDYIWAKLMRYIGVRDLLCTSAGFNNVATEKNNLTTETTLFRKQGVKVHVNASCQWLKIFITRWSTVIMGNGMNKVDFKNCFKSAFSPPGSYQIYQIRHVFCSVLICRELNYMRECWDHVEAGVDLKEMFITGKPWWHVKVTCMYKYIPDIIKSVTTERKYTIYSRSLYFT